MKLIEVRGFIEGEPSSGCLRTEISNTHPESVEEANRMTTKAKKIDPRKELAKIFSPVKMSFPPRNERNFQYGLAH